MKKIGRFGSLKGSIARDKSSEIFEKNVMPSPFRLRIINYLMSME